MTKQEFLSTVKTYLTSDLSDSSYFSIDYWYPLESIKTDIPVVAFDLWKMYDDDMTVNYNKLWKKLIDLEMSRTEMRLKAGISTKQLAKLGKNENVNTEILVRICQTLHCNIDEIMDIVEQKEDTV